MDVGVVKVQDTICQLHKFDNLSNETEKAVKTAQALVKDSESSRQVVHRFRIWLCRELNNSNNY